MNRPSLARALTGLIGIALLAPTPHFVVKDQQSLPVSRGRKKFKPSEPRHQQRRRRHRRS
jgi:hypothetical protein